LRIKASERQKYFAKDKEGRKRQLANLKHIDITKVNCEPFKKKDYSKDIIAFAEEQIILPESKKLIKLEDWERKLLKDCFYGDRPSLVLLSVGKKNGKSTLSAIILLWQFFTQEPGESYICSNSMDQSSFIVFRKCVKMIQANHELDRRCKIYGDYIEYSNGSLLRCLPSSYRSSSGLNPLMISIDEIANFDVDSLSFFYDELQLSPIYEFPLIFITSTVSRSQKGILWTLFEEAKKGNTEDSYFFIRQGEQANPSSFVTNKYLTRQKNKPGMRENLYQRLHLNLWTSEEEQFITNEDYLACVDYSLARRPNRRANIIVGLDVGYRNDYTGVVTVTRTEGGIELIDHKLFIPEGTLIFSDVQNYILDLNKDYFLESVVYDPYQAVSLSQDLANAGIKMVELPQTQANTTAFSQNLFSLIKEKNISFYESEELRLQLMNAKAKESDRGWRITKRKQSEKIDLVIALAMAAYEGMKSEGQEPYTLEDIENMVNPGTDYQQNYGRW